MFLLLRASKNVAILIVMSPCFIDLSMNWHASMKQGYIKNLGHLFIFHIPSPLAIFLIQQLTLVQFIFQLLGVAPTLQQCVTTELYLSFLDLIFSPEFWLDPCRQIHCDLDFVTVWQIAFNFQNFLSTYTKIRFACRKLIDSAFPDVVASHLYSIYIQAAHDGGFLR